MTASRVGADRTAKTETPTAPARARRRVAPMIAALGLGALLFGATGDAAAADKINIGVLKIAGVANAWVARDQGMYTKNNLEAKLVEFNSGAAAVAAAQAGDVDVFLSIAGSAMTAMERGFDLVAVFQNEVGRTSGPESSAVQVAEKSNIRALTDLAGKKMGVSSLNSQQVVGVQLILKRAGVDPRSLQYIEMPFPALGNALKAGHVDAIVPVDPFTTQLLASGDARVLAWSYAQSIPGQPLGVWWARGAFANRNPSAIEGFNKAMKESIDYMNADADRARRDVTAITGLNPDLVRTMPPPSLDYRVRPDNWQKVIDMLVEFKVLQKPHKAEEYLTAFIRPYIVN